MITDKLVNLKKYPEFAAYAEDMIAFAERVEKENLEDGRYELQGENLFALLQTYVTKNVEEARMETHKIYNDLQYVVSESDPDDIAGLEFEAGLGCPAVYLHSSLLTCILGDCAPLDYS